MLFTRVLKGALRWSKLSFTSLVFASLFTGFSAFGFETLDFLESIQGKKTIGAMHNRQPNSDPNSYSRKLKRITEEWPGLYGTDFQFEPQEVAHRQTITDQVIREWRNGSMVHLMWHACNPAKENPCQWDSQGVLSRMSNFEWSQLITDGTNINSTWKMMMDDVAFYIQQMEDAGVEVLFRPIHEMNQGAFWWGGRPGANGTARLYQITYDYLTHEKGLTNIIWLWNLQDFATLETDLIDYDPGPEYWDVLTMDMYWSDGQGYSKEKYDAFVAKAAGKPIAIGECSELPTPRLLAEQPLWTFFMPWSELTFEENSKNRIRNIYQSQRVLVLDEMPGWSGGQFFQQLNADSDIE